jgi:hypothetical protein
MMMMIEETCLPDDNSSAMRLRIMAPAPPAIWSCFSLAFPTPSTTTWQQLQQPGHWAVDPASLPCLKMPQCWAAAWALGINRRHAEAKLRSLHTAISGTSATVEDTHPFVKAVQEAVFDLASQRHVMLYICVAVAHMSLVLQYCGDNTLPGQLDTRAGNKRVKRCGSTASDARKLNIWRSSRITFQVGEEGSRNVAAEHACKIHVAA